ncbi:hypothetical protein HOU95_gp049 [Streptomyces phage Hiyaa]|uniref:Uncharacterized protein n=1 Tax=Streptomyces phage Hiyaa TaxID=2499072 RepID=A0A3S9U903_9CAUD|nr:hypothetical protein HOU95_gp049 [Streptomyces phage Hiyaa]AZS06758.1 hypothetical protein SEA_HIYAA_119 [Streptomyces phage Hiyaa]
MDWNSDKAYQQPGETEEEYLSRIEAATDRDAWYSQDA